jgi:hypothetical protein
VSASTSTYSNSLTNSIKPFFHSEGGSAEKPVTLKDTTFTTTSDSLGSLSYSVVEIIDGAISIIGCTFSDLKMNPAAIESGNNGVLFAAGASVTLRNTVFRNISLETSASILGSGNSECEWGLYSVIVLREALTLIKDTVMLNTFAGISVHGGTASLEGTDFSGVGSKESSKYPSVERHLQCGIFKKLLLLL